MHRFQADLGLGDTVPPITVAKKRTGFELPGWHCCDRSPEEATGGQGGKGGPRWGGSQRHSRGHPHPEMRGSRRAIKGDTPIIM